MPKKIYAIRVEGKPLFEFFATKKQETEMYKKHLIFYNKEEIERATFIKE